MDTRIGYPNEHLAGDSEDNQTSPVYSTAVGLLMTALKENFDTNELVVENDSGDDNLEKLDKDLTNPENVRRSTIFERWTEKFKEFLDKA
jgi:cell division protein FtsA